MHWGPVQQRGTAPCTRAKQPCSRACFSGRSAPLQKHSGVATDVHAAFNRVSSAWTLPAAASGSAGEFRGAARGSAPGAPARLGRRLDVDEDLWEVLDLCSDDELVALYNMLHSASPFSPLLKTLVRQEQPAALADRGRPQLMRRIESRFRFLAADSQAVLAGQRPGYRSTLLRLCRQLGCTVSDGLAPADLETEVFVQLLQSHAHLVAGLSAAPGEYVDAAYEGDGMGGSALLPPQPAKPGRANVWAQRLAAPLALGAKQLLPAAAKVLSAASVFGLGQQAVRTLGGNLMAQHLRYQALLTWCSTGATSSRLAARVLSAATQGLTSATARYAGVRGALSLAGPIMWGWMAVELSLAAMGTDWARITRAVFLLAQVRLLRTAGFVNPPKLQHGAPIGKGAGA